MSSWNRCDDCGQFIAYADFNNGAIREYLLPDSEFSKETYETVCVACVKKRNEIKRKAAFINLMTGRLV